MLFAWLSNPRFAGSSTGTTRLASANGHGSPMPRLLIILALCGMYGAAWSATITARRAAHNAAIAAGWIEGTDGYYRAIYGPDAY